MAEDLMIEVSGSSKKAETALDRIIKKIDELQSHFEKAAPSVSKFAAQMDKISSSSKAFTAFQKIAQGADKQALSTKNAESRMAMYQARLDRANISMEKSRVQSEKLAAAQAKLAGVQKIAAHNERAFSASPEDFSRKFSKAGQGINFTPESPLDTYEPTPAPGTSRLASEMFKNSSASIHIDTSQAQTAVQNLQAFIDGLNPSIAHMSSDAQTEFSALAARLMLVGQQVDNQRALYHKLAAESGQVAGKSGETSAAYLRMEKRMLSAAGAIDRLIAKQDKLKTQMSELSGSANIVSSVVESAPKKATSGMQKTLHMMESMLIRIAAFRAFSALSQGITTGINNMVQANSQANATMSALATNSLYLKNSLAASLMPALQALVPIINQVTDALANVFNTIGMLTARIFNHATTATIAKRANVDYAATLDKTKNSADAAKKSLMGFDELNLLSSQKSASASNSNPGMPAYKDMFKTVKVPDWINKIGNMTDKVQKMIRDNVDSVERILNFAPLVVGAVLAFSGVNVPLGIGLMAWGAVRMTKQAKEDWDYLTNKTNSSLSKTKRALQIVGAVELAIGAILAFSGANVGLGIALMAGGITTTAATLNWDSISPKIKQSIGAITFGTAAAMLALGAIFAFSGANIPLGIGLLVAGATTMWASSSLNWGQMSNQLKEKVGEWTIIASGALLALGAVMLCTGHIGLGVGMIIGGIVGIASAAALNWNSMSDQLRGTLTSITIMVGIFTLALGAALLFTGVATPVGIALLAMGATSLVAAAALNWDSIKNKIKTVLADIVAIVSAASIAIGIILCLTGGGIPLGIGLIVAGFAGSKLAKAINLDPITNWAQRLVDKITGVFNKGVDSMTKKYEEAGKGLGGSGFKGGGGGFGGGGGIRYASGTALHAGGPALVNDQLGPTYQELIHLPNGLSFIPSGRNVLIPDLPSGSSVLNASATKELFPSYADGIGSAFQPIHTEPSESGGLDTERIVERLNKLEKAILDRPISIYADSREIARASNEGNRVLNRKEYKIAST